MELSNRLRAILNLAGKGNVLADVGTDHGYIPIQAMLEKRFTRAIAMDVKEGPLSRAREHIARYLLSDSIEIRLSDGLEALGPGEADCVVIAGMGGALTLRILENAGALRRSRSTFILQPQSEIPFVRESLPSLGLSIMDEDMVLEDGKFYPMMKVVPVPSSRQPFKERDELEVYYGSFLLMKKHPVLKEYLLWEAQNKRKVLQNLERSSGEEGERRKTEVLACLSRNEKALRRLSEYEM